MRIDFIYLQIKKTFFFFPEFRHQNWVCAYRRRNENDIKVEKKLHLNCTAIPPGPDLIPGRCYIGFGPVSHWLRDIGFGPVSQMPEAGCTNARGQYHKCLRPVARMPEAGITLSPGRYHVAFGPVSWPRLDHAGPGGMAVQFRCSRFSIFISVCGFLRYADTRKTICNNQKNDFRKEKK